MQAMQLTGIRQMQLRTVPDPEIRRPDDVLLRIRAVGVCGSDVHYYTQGRIGSQVVSYPFAVGHEAAGVVEAVGPAVRHVRPGDRVAVDPPVSCHACDQCQSGRHHTCRKLKYLGCPGQLEGCLGELLVMPEECCFPLPATMSFADAALIEPLSIGVYAVRQSIPMPGAKVGILGAGPIGVSVMLPALAAGAAAVYVTDPIAPRRDLVCRHGACWAGDPGRLDVVQEIGEREPLLLDVVFECCGQQSALDQGLALLKPGGKLMLIGIPEFERYSFDAETGRRRELCLQHVRRQNACVQPALDLVVGGKVAPGFMVTHTFSLARAKEAFDLVAGYTDGVLKAMIEVG
jgi:L-iditol 2-dehydrogenase